VVRFFLCAAVLVTAFAGAALAAPAPWYKYQSLATGRYVCTQTDPGKHYMKFAGPFSNAGCRP